MKQLAILEQSAMLDFIQNNTVSSLYENAKESVENGEKSPLEVYQAFKMFSDAFDKLNKDNNFKDYVISESSRHITSYHSEQKPAILNGFKMFYSKHVTTIYNDTVLDKLKTKVKERENYLKRLEQVVIDELTGEVLAEPVTYRTKQTLICTKA